jgi:ribosome-binding protein aMBF1 (putative translation factor)
MKNYAPLLEEFMSRENLSFDECAERLGVSSVIVRLWVKGSRTPTRKNQQTLERVLGISSNLHDRTDQLEARIKRLEDAHA